MKNLIVTLLAGFFWVQVQAADAWMTDASKAFAKAKKENKLVLLDFTGKDWCAGCKLLRKNVLSSKEFTEYAKGKLILVELDFPMDKPAKRVNEELSDKYKVEGFPTVVLTKPDGTALGQISAYEGEDAKEYIAKLDKIARK